MFYHILGLYIIGYYYYPVHELLTDVCKTGDFLKVYFQNKLPSYTVTIHFLFNCLIRSAEDQIERSVKTAKLYWKYK